MIAAFTGIGSFPATSVADEDGSNPAKSASVRARAPRLSQSGRAAAERRMLDQHQLIRVAVRERTEPSDADARAGAPAVALLSHSFWIRRFGGSPEVLGRTMTLTDVAITGEALVIVGVLHQDFRFPVADPQDRASLFVRTQPDVILVSRSDAWQQVLGRLSPGSTPPAAAAELSGIFRQTAAAHYSARLVERTQVVATPLQHRLVGNTRHRLLLMAAVSCVRRAARVDPVRALRAD